MRVENNASWEIVTVKYVIVYVTDEGAMEGVFFLIKSKTGAHFTINFAKVYLTLFSKLIENHPDSQKQVFVKNGD